VCTLGINSDVRSVLDWRCLFFPSFSFSLFSSPKPFLFPQPTKPISDEQWSRTHLPLDHREIWVPCLQPNFKNSHHWELQKHVKANRNTLRTVAFSFPTETQNGLSKTTIPVSLTVGFSWNLDMLFEIQFLTLSPFGICEIIFL